MFFEGAAKHGVEQKRRRIKGSEAEAFIGEECKRSMVGPQVDVREMSSHAFKGLRLSGMRGVGGVRDVSVEPAPHESEGVVVTGHDL